MEAVAGGFLFVSALESSEVESTSTLTTTGGGAASVMLLVEPFRDGLTSLVEFSAFLSIILFEFITSFSRDINDSLITLFVNC